MVFAIAEGMSFRAIILLLTLTISSVAYAGKDKNCRAQMGGNLGENKMAKARNLAASVFDKSRSKSESPRTAR